MRFISEDFRSLMLEIWRVKYLQMPRFREVISSIPIEIRLEHFLNDGDSPDIPIPIYVEYLNRIRNLARNAEKEAYNLLVGAAPFGAFCLCAHPALYGFLS